MALGQANPQWALHSQDLGFERQRGGRLDLGAGVVGSDDLLAGETGEGAPLGPVLAHPDRVTKASAHEGDRG